MNKIFCKKIFVALAIAMTFLSLQSCTSLSELSTDSSVRNAYNFGSSLRGGMSDEDARRNGYNMGVLLGGGNPSLLREKK